MIVVVDENDEFKRIDTFLAEVSGVSRSKVQAAIKAGEVKVNAKKVKPSFELKEGDSIEYDFKESSEIVIAAQNIALDIVYEDENMAVVNKPSGMLTHPTSLEFENTLVNALLYKYGSNLSDLNGNLRYGIVHRLDRNTSGLLMIAKNNDTHRYLAELIKNHRLTKKYRAIVKGIYPLEEDRIEFPIGRSITQPHKMSVRQDGKESLTLLKVLKRFKEATYVELTLVTGRTHQIRVHMSAKNHPIYNDSLYGAGQGKVKTDEQVLQSYYLKFTKPFSDEIIELQIEPDEKISKVLKYLENKD